MDLHPSAADPGSDDDDTPRDKRVVVGSKAAGNAKKKRLQITSGEDGYESNSSMPGLLDVSNSEEDDEEEESEDYSDEDEDEEDDSDDDDEASDEYNSDEEEEIRHMFREAMNTYNENPDIVDDADKYADERKKNPFLKLLGSLKGLYPRQYTNFLRQTETLCFVRSNVSKEFCSSNRRKDYSDFDFRS